MVRNSARVAKQSLDAAGTPSADSALLPDPMIHLRHRCTLGCVIITISVFVIFVQNLGEERKCRFF